jgi:hypothetical protein
MNSYVIRDGIRFERDSSEYGYKKSAQDFYREFFNIVSCLANLPFKGSERCEKISQKITF